MYSHMRYIFWIVLFATTTLSPLAFSTAMSTESVGLNKTSTDLAYHNRRWDGHRSYRSYYYSNPNYYSGYHRNIYYERTTYVCDQSGYCYYSRYPGGRYYDDGYYYGDRYYNGPGVYFRIAL